MGQSFYPPSSQPLTLLRFCNRVKRRRKDDLLLTRPVIPLLRGRVGPEKRSMGLTIGRWVILPAATRSSALSETRVARANCQDTRLDCKQWPRQRRHNRKRRGSGKRGTVRVNSDVARCF